MIKLSPAEGFSIDGGSKISHDGKYAIILINNNASILKKVSIKDIVKNQ